MNSMIFYTAAEDKELTGASESFQYRTSSTLMENIIGKKEVMLFDKQPCETKTGGYVDEKGKRVTLTPFQMRVVTAFAQIVDEQRTRSEVAEYIDILTPEYVDERTQQYYKYGSLPSPVSCVVDVQAITKEIYDSTRVGGKQTAKVKEEIYNLSKIYQTITFEKGTLSVERKAPLIRAEEYTFREEGVVKGCLMNITFDDVFVYDINNRFALASKTILKQWKEKGLQTEFFTTLLFLLLNKRGIYVKNALIKAQKLRKEYRKDKVEPKKAEEKILKQFNQALTYKEGLSSLLDRLDSKKYVYQTGTRKGKVRADIIKRDLYQSVDALKNMGIIKDYKETTGSDGGIMCNFVFNEDYIQDEKIKQQNALSELSE